MPEPTEMIEWAIAAFAAIALLRLIDVSTAKLSAVRQRYCEWRWGRAWEANKDGWPS